MSDASVMTREDETGCVLPVASSTQQPDIWIELALKSGLVAGDARVSRHNRIAFPNPKSEIPNPKFPMFPSLSQRVLIPVAAIVGGMVWLWATPLVEAADGWGGLSLFDAQVGVVLAVVLMLL